eukprot:CAMPEP_0179090586 /NCGR_PEP_ID=MMETSP0796-20121207/41335_1 /TAXON_ID=73915 /ORGANISM="Pyrodinium bahamense, Strain pbaha01" /LENGTH=364 /DNA_ID=CAMNT_0020788159 /DNA_START=16 /DNA_END=1108 /DNA_ORIENTATION=-
MSQRSSAQTPAVLSQSRYSSSVQDHLRHASDLTACGASPNHHRRRANRVARREREAVREGLDRRHGQQPRQVRSAKQLLDIPSDTKAVGVPSPEAHLDGGEVACQQPAVGEKECPKGNAKGGRQHATKAEEHVSLQRQCAPRNSRARTEEHRLQLRERGEDIQHARKRAIHRHEDEKLVVPEADAVADPRAVVVHAQHAAPADAAMVGTLRAAPPAPVTDRGLARLPLAPGPRQRGLERVPLLRHEAGVRERTAQEAPECEQPGRVEGARAGQGEDQRVPMPPLKVAHHEEDVVGVPLKAKQPTMASTGMHDATRTMRFLANIGVVQDNTASVKAGQQQGVTAQAVGSHGQLVHSGGHWSKTPA